MARYGLEILVFLVGTLLLFTVQGWEWINEEEHLNVLQKADWGQLPRAMSPRTPEDESSNSDHEELLEDFFEVAGEASHDYLDPPAPHQVEADPGYSEPRSWDSGHQVAPVPLPAMNPTSGTPCGTQMPPSDQASWPGSSTPSSSGLVVFCSDAGFKITLPCSLRKVNVDGNEFIPVVKVETSCGYNLDFLTNTLHVPFSGCNVKKENDGYTLRLMHHDKSGRSQVTTAYCPPSPVLPPPPSDPSKPPKACNKPSIPPAMNPTSGTPAVPPMSWPGSSTPSSSGLVVFCSDAGFKITLPCSLRKVKVNVDGNEFIPVVKVETSCGYNLDFLTNTLHVPFSGCNVKKENDGYTLRLMHHDKSGRSQVTTAYCPPSPVLPPPPSDAYNKPSIPPAMNPTSGTPGENQMPPSSPMSWPGSSTPSSSGLVVFCSDAGFKITLPCSLRKVNVDGNEFIPVVKVETSCGYNLDFLTNTLHVPFSGCNVKKENDGYTLRLMHHDKSGRSQVTTAYCPPSPVLPPPPSDAYNKPSIPPAMNPTSGTPGENQMPPSSPMSWPGSSTPSSSGLVVFCSDAGFKITLPCSLRKVNVDGNEFIPVVKVETSCGYNLDFLTNTLHVPFSGCNVKKENDGYTLRLMHHDKSGRSQVTTAYCPPSPVLPPPPSDAYNKPSIPPAMNPTSGTPCGNQMPPSDQASWPGNSTPSSSGLVVFCSDAGFKITLPCSLRKVKVNVDGNEFIPVVKVETSCGYNLDFLTNTLHVPFSGCNVKKENDGYTLRLMHHDKSGRSQVTTAYCPPSPVLPPPPSDAYNKPSIPPAMNPTSGTPGENQMPPSSPMSWPGSSTPSSSGLVVFCSDAGFKITLPCSLRKVNVNVDGNEFIPVVKVETSCGYNLDFLTNTLHVPFSGCDVKKENDGYTLRLMHHDKSGRSQVTTAYCPPSPVLPPPPNDPSKPPKACNNPSIPRAMNPTSGTPCGNQMPPSDQASWPGNSTPSSSGLVVFCSDAGFKITLPCSLRKVKVNVDGNEFIPVVKVETSCGYNLDFLTNTLHVPFSGCNVKKENDGYTLRLMHHDKSGRSQVTTAYCPPSPVLPPPPSDAYNKPSIPPAMNPTSGTPGENQMPPSSPMSWPGSSTPSSSGLVVFCSDAGFKITLPCSLRKVNVNVDGNEFIPVVKVETSCGYNLDFLTNTLHVPFSGCDVKKENDGYTLRLMHHDKSGRSQVTTAYCPPSPVLPPPPNDPSKPPKACNNPSIPRAMNPTSGTPCGNQMPPSDQASWPGNSTPSSSGLVVFCSDAGFKITLPCSLRKVKVNVDGNEFIPVVKVETSCGYNLDFLTNTLHVPFSGCNVKKENDGYTLRLMHHDKSGRSQVTTAYCPPSPVLPPPPSDAYNKPSIPPAMNPTSGTPGENQMPPSSPMSWPGSSTPSSSGLVVFCSDAGFKITLPCSLRKVNVNVDGNEFIPVVKVETSCGYNLDFLTNTLHVPFSGCNVKKENDGYTLRLMHHDKSGRSQVTTAYCPPSPVLPPPPNDPSKPPKACNNPSIPRAMNPSSGTPCGNQMPPSDQASWPGSSTPSSSGLVVFCSDAGFKITLPCSLRKVNVNVDGNEFIPVVKVETSCGYNLDFLTNTLHVPFSGCDVKKENDGYTLRLMHHDKSGRSQVTTAYCPPSPVLPPPPSDAYNKPSIPPAMNPTSGTPGGNQMTFLPPPGSDPSTPSGLKFCAIPTGEQLPCGQMGMSPSACEKMGCCFSSRSTCYYPMDACTQDQNFVFAIRYNSASAAVDPTKLVIPASPNCKPVIVNNKVAIFKFKVTDCGTRTYMVGDTKVHLAEVRTILPSLNLKYGVISRSDPLKFLVECRYGKPDTGTLHSLASIGYLVLTPSSSLPSAIVSSGVYGVQLRIARDSTYSSFFSSCHAPLHLLLGKPVYLELRLQSPIPNAVILVNYCIAYSHSSKTALVLVFEGCANPYDPHVAILAVSDLPTNRYQRRFIVKAFQFMEQKTNKYLDEEIHFMCSAEVCRPDEKICEEQCFDKKAPPRLPTKHVSG